MTISVAAVDLGASSGRVVRGTVSRDVLRLETVVRFPNLPVRTVEGLHWSFGELARNVGEGIAAAALPGPLASAGIDSWAVDYGIVRQGRLLGMPRHYRDERNARAVAAAQDRVTADELFAINGLQHLPFNTLYQLFDDARTGWLREGDSVLMIPDLLAFELTGVRGAERTNASTTGLVDIGTGGWSADLFRRLDIPFAFEPGLTEPGTLIGEIAPDVREAYGIGPVRIRAVASHDTASAVAAVPATGSRFAYISSGTWALVGLELVGPVRTPAVREENFTNELGVDGTVRFLRNVNGLWLLNETKRRWERNGRSVDLAALAAAAEAADGEPVVFDSEDPRFLPPGDMPRRIADWCVEHGIAPPSGEVATVRSILVSLAHAYARAVATASRLSGFAVDSVHIVGGGAQIPLLCQSVADRTGLPVVAGPVEATSIGNVLVQARAAGELSGALADLRDLVGRTQSLRRYFPR
ncbi:rhamnulokinase family protein [Naasia sp. SYSU D00057]|uniref:rhamnulokinase n=1 Tax=Naasia sp. SYSU D00057 TaxID=2817380 RepID=UPI001B3118A9|nr:rhamnulokinase family protein [Naasia sp. SYSU D00057]